MKDIIEENKRLQIEVEKLINQNMEMVGVIRSLRKNAKEDAAELDNAISELWLWKNGKYEKEETK
jgi:regulator of replication initiation timing